MNGPPHIWCADGEWHIDVRGLPPPEPMLAVVALIERPDLRAVGSTVILHHERDPVFLYPELAERGWRWAMIAGEPGEICLRLQREGA